GTLTTHPSLHPLQLRREGPRARPATPARPRGIRDQRGREVIDRVKRRILRAEDPPFYWLWNPDTTDNVTVVPGLTFVRQPDKTENSAGPVSHDRTRNGGEPDHEQTDRQTAYDTYRPTDRRG